MAGMDLRNSMAGAVLTLAVDEDGLTIEQIDTTLAGDVTYWVDVVAATGFFSLSDLAAIEEWLTSRPIELIEHLAAEADQLTAAAARQRIDAQRGFAVA